MQWVIDLTQMHLDMNRGQAHNEENCPKKIQNESKFCFKQCFPTTAMVGRRRSYFIQFLPTSLYIDGYAPLPLPPYPGCNYLLLPLILGASQDLIARMGGQPIVPLPHTCPDMGSNCLEPRLETVTQEDMTAVNARRTNIC